MDNATSRLSTSFVTKEAIEVGKGGGAATQDVCRILMAVKLMGDVRTTGEIPRVACEVLTKAQNLKPQTLKP